MATHAEKARDNFLAGYNCAQAVACAFAEEMGMTVDRVLRRASAADLAGCARYAAR